MHGVLRVKTSDELLAARKKEELAQIDNYNRLVQDVTTHRKENKLDSTALEATEKVLLLNGEYYSLWNYRREILLDLLKTVHCWAYRQWVATEAKVPISTSLEFTKEKIEQNFSNYSAWHERSRLLALLPDASQQLEQELELAQQAIFTEPKDQSAWIYYRWLLGLSTNEKTNQASLVGQLPAAEQQVLLKSELEKLEELLAEEPNSKCTSLLLVRKLKDTSATVQQRLVRLRELDPAHLAFYGHLASLPVA